MLLEKGADVNLGNGTKLPFTYGAVFRDSLEIMELLVEAGVDMNQRDGEGQYCFGLRH